MGTNREGSSPLKLRHKEYKVQELMSFKSSEACLFAFLASALASALGANPPIALPRLTAPLPVTFALSASNPAGDVQVLRHVRCCDTLPDVLEAGATRAARLGRRPHQRQAGRKMPGAYSEAPRGRKYWVPLTGSWRRLRRSWRSSLRSTKSMSEVLMTRRSEAA